MPATNSRKPAAKARPASATAKRTSAKPAAPKARANAKGKAAPMTPAEAKRERLNWILIGLVLAFMAGTGLWFNYQAHRGPGPEFVTAKDGQFWLEGKPFYYAGTNNYEQMYVGAPTGEAFFQLAADENAGAVRSWAFFDIGAEDGTGGVEIANKGAYFQYWDPETGHPAYNDGANGLERLDYMIYAAGLKGEKLVLPLMNNWVAFGGVDQYVRWAGGQYHDEFLYNETVKGWYKDWVSHLLNRVNTYTGVAYKDDPTIMMWELGNELRCSESGPYPTSPDGCTADAFTAWAREMSDYVRSIDRNHLIAFGGEGFLCDEPGGSYWLTNCTEAGDPAAILALPNIDAHGIHIYPNHWNPQAPHEDWEEFGIWWIQRHGELADAAGKPFYIGEYGWLDKETRLPVFDAWLEAFYAAGGDGSHYWMMHPRSSLAQDPDGLGFTERCPSPVCTLVSDWSVHMRDGTPFEEFAPLADGDFHSTAPGVAVSFDLLANDKAWGTNTLDPASVDLDPDAPGVQSELTGDLGTVTVSGGVLTFTPTGDATGSFRLTYTVADSTGVTTDPAPVSISVIAP